MNLSSGDSLEIIVDNEEIHIKKYSLLKNIQPISDILTEAIYELLKKTIIICDLEHVISYRGIKIKDKEISDNLKVLINRKESILEKYKKDLIITSSTNVSSPYAITTIVNEGIPIGLVIILDDTITKIEMDYCLIASKILNKYVM